MQRLLLLGCLAAILTGEAFAQGANVVRRRGAGVPTGGCSFIQDYIDTNTGLFYTCWLGVWNVTGGSGSGSPGGATTQVQFNDAGSFGGDASFAWDTVNKALTLDGSVRYATYVAEKKLANSDVFLNKLVYVGASGSVVAAGNSVVGIAHANYSEGNGNATIAVRGVHPCVLANTTALRDLLTSGTGGDTGKCSSLGTDDQAAVSITKQVIGRALASGSADGTINVELFGLGLYGGQVTKTDVGLGSVENTALSTWPGSGNITGLGAVTSGSILYSLVIGTPDLTQYLLRSGGIMTGLHTLVAPGASQESLVMPSGTSPTTPSTGSLWHRSADSKLHFYDGTADRTLVYASELAVFTAGTGPLYKTDNASPPTLTTRLALNSQTGTSYELLAGDNGKVVRVANASSIAITIAQAGTTGFESGYTACVMNDGTGTTTVTPTTSTINGSATATVSTGETACLTSDGTNYNNRHSRLTAGANITLTKSRTGTEVAASGGGSTKIFKADQQTAQTISGSGTWDLTGTSFTLGAGDLGSGACLGYRAKLTVSGGSLQRTAKMCLGGTGTNTCTSGTVVNLMNLYSGGNGNFWLDGTWCNLESSTSSQEFQTIAGLDGFNGGGNTQDTQTSSLDTTASQAIKIQVLTDFADTIQVNYFHVWKKLF